jgi:hypothetical protein
MALSECPINVKLHKFTRVHPWVHCEWYKQRSVRLTFTALRTPGCPLLGGISCATNELRDCPGGGHTKAERMELEGVYLAGGN